MTTRPLWLFLRSAHKGIRERFGPPPPADLSQNVDMWTHLFAEACERAGVNGLIARMGDAYRIQYTPHLAEWRVPDLAELSVLAPEVVIDRGGYREYGALYKALAAVGSSPHTVFIGCGERYNPSAWRYMAHRRYDLIVVDTIAQRDEVAADMPGSAVSVFHKPACDSIFFPVACTRKYDLVFNCHRPEEFKGCKWLAERIPAGLRVLRIGPRDPWFGERADRGELQVTFTDLVPRQCVPVLACQAHVGVVCDDGTRDSGPRVLPEFLAMDIPVLVRNTVRMDLDAYVTPETGRVVGDDDFVERYTEVRSARHLLSSRLHYDRNLCMALAADRLVEEIQAPRGAAAAGGVQ